MVQFIAGEKEITEFFTWPRVKTHVQYSEKDTFYTLIIFFHIYILLYNLYIFLIVEYYIVVSYCYIPQPSTLYILIVNDLVIECKLVLLFKIIYPPIHHFMTI